MYKIHGGSYPSEFSGRGEEASDKALEKFLSSWTHGVTGTHRMSLEQMMSVQKAQRSAAHLERMKETADQLLQQLEMLQQDRTLLAGSRPRLFQDRFAQ